MKRIFFLVVCTAVFSGDLFSASDSFDPNNKRTYIEGLFGNTALHLFAATKELQYEQKIDWLYFNNSVNKIGDTALHVAARFDSSWAVSLFLHKARALGDFEIYRKFLLKRNNDGDTALMLARRAIPSDFRTYLPNSVELLTLAEKALMRGEPYSFSFGKSR